MSLDKQAIALSKIGFTSFPRKDTDATTDEIYDKGFVVFADQIRWDRATEGIAKECVENAEKYLVTKFLCFAKEDAKMGYFDCVYTYTDVGSDWLYRIARILDAEGFIGTTGNTLSGARIKIDWSQASFGKALEYREIAQDFNDRKKPEEKKTCTIM